MQSLLLAILLQVGLYVLANTQAIQLHPRQGCGNGYEPCSPPGALGTSFPSIGSGLVPLYVELLDSVNAQHASIPTDAANAPAKREEDALSTICCASGTQCLLLRGFNVPMCWDRFTTNFYLPDGSFGTIDNGSYATPAGDQANLITGGYRLVSGVEGNFYNGTPTAEPNTSTLLIPTPWTSTGVGTAIPGSQLGNLATYTTTIPGSYIPPITVAPSTAPPVTGYGASTVGNATVFSGYTLPGTSIPPLTITVTTTRPSITPPINPAGAQSLRLDPSSIILGMTSFALGAVCFGLPGVTVFLVTAFCFAVVKRLPGVSA